MQRRVKAGLSLMSFVLALGLTAAAPTRADASVWKVNICHVPPGNPANAKTIRVGVAAVPAHLMHGDRFGGCDDGGTL